jgi:hypothetical protein
MAFRSSVNHLVGVFVLVALKHMGLLGPLYALLRKRRSTRCRGQQVAPPTSDLLDSPMTDNDSAACMSVSLRL